MSITLLNLFYLFIFQISSYLCVFRSASASLTLSFHCVWVWVIDWAKPSHMIRGCLYHTLAYPESHWDHRSFIAETNVGKILPLTYFSYIQGHGGSVTKVCFMKRTQFSKFTNEDLRFWPFKDFSPIELNSCVHCSILTKTIFTQSSLFTETYWSTNTLWMIIWNIR